MFTTASVDWYVDWPTARFATNRSAVHRSCAPLLIGRDRRALERRSCLLMIKYLSSWWKSLNLNSGIEPKIYIRSISNSICLAFCNIRHTSYLSILVHRHLIHSSRKYTKKFVNSRRDNQKWSKWAKISLYTSGIYILFGVLFTGLNDVAVYQNGQIWGMQ